MERGRVKLASNRDITGRALHVVHLLFYPLLYFGVSAKMRVFITIFFLPSCLQKCQKFNGTLFVCLKQEQKTVISQSTEGIDYSVAEMNLYMRELRS